MIDQGIVNHIKISIEKGETEEVVKARLLQAGHSQEVVESAFAEYRNPTEKPKKEHVAPISSAHENVSWLRGLFRGRVGGWTWFLGGISVSIFAAALGFIFTVLPLLTGSSFLAFILFIPLWIFSSVLGLSLLVRRLHDKGLTGWFAILSFIPLVNFLFFLYLILTADSSANHYGVRDQRTFFNRVFNTHHFSNKTGIILILLLALCIVASYMYFNKQIGQDLSSARQRSSDAVVESKLKFFQNYAESEFDQNQNYSNVCSGVIHQRTFEKFDNTNSACNSSEEAFMAFVAVYGGFFCVDSTGFWGKVPQTKELSCQ